MRSLVVVFSSAALSVGAVCGCNLRNELGNASPVDATPHDAAHDAALGADGTVAVDGSIGDADANELEAPPPIESDGDLFDGGPPPDGARVEKTIGAAGGTLSGDPGTPLAGVVLEVPAGALASDVILALDVGTGAPPAGTLVSPIVLVGPDGTLFAKPARLTLPYTMLTSPQLAMVARIGFSWSSLLDPSGNSGAKTLTASMSRASGAAVVAVDLTSIKPVVKTVSPADAGPGATLFIEGSGFGIAPVWQPGADGGADFVSSVTVGGAAAKTLAWDDGAITVQGTTAGAVNVTTPGGSALSP